METTKLSSKGQVIIPKAFRNTHHWEAGLELLVIDTGDGVLLKPKAPFQAATLVEAAGVLKNKSEPRSDEQIQNLLKQDVQRKWRGRH